MRRPDFAVKFRVLMGVTNGPFQQEFLQGEKYQAVGVVKPFGCAKQIHQGRRIDFRNRVQSSGQFFGEGANVGVITRFDFERIEHAPPIKRDAPGFAPCQNCLI